jgi:hypothetical protein
VNELLLAIFVFAVSFAIGMGRTGPRLISEVWFHGLDNHFCQRVGCCR